MTIGMLAVTTENAALFFTNGNGGSLKIAHLTREPVLVVGKWVNPKKEEDDDSDYPSRYCDMYRVITSLGLGWLSEEEVQVVP